LSNPVIKDIMYPYSRVLCYNMLTSIVGSCPNLFLA